MKTISFDTLGCSKNTVDTQKLTAGIDTTKYQISYGRKVHTLVINTCGFIKSAKKENIKEILRNAAEKKKGYIKRLVVIGCLTERYGDELMEQIPQIDKIFGANQLEEVLNYLNETTDSKIGTDRELGTRCYSSYLKISEGCSRQCSFCAIPNIRGKHISVKIETLLEEAQKLADKGVKELVVIAQDTTFYGMDIYGERKLAELLDKLSDIKQFEWIRLMYAFPADFPDDVLEVIANKPNICKYLDIPLQHISTKILKAMNRGIDKEGTIELIKRIREKVPGISLRTTFLVGYPGETQEDFDELIQFIKEMKFERVGCFVYSEEEGTPAYKIKDSIPSKIKNKRLDKLMLTQQRISLEHNRSLVGKELRVLIDDDIIDEEDAEELEEDLCYSGRTQSDAPEVDNAVIIYTENKLELGSFVNVRITEANEYDIYGEIIE